MKIVVIGGVAAGPKVAAKIMRLNPNADVTIVDRGEFLSYAGCGLPYYISGVVKDQKELMETPIGVVRDPDFFKKIKNINVLNHTEATKIDRKNRRIHILSKEGTKDVLDYDKLVLCTGAKPVKPPLPGINLDKIYTLQGIEDAEGIKDQLKMEKALDAVIVGGGLIGVETAEALVKKGCRVTMIELLPRILTILDPELVYLVRRHFESNGVKVLTKTKVMGFDGRESVETVLSDKSAIKTDMVILAVGVRPNIELAENAGLDIGSTGGIKVNEKMQTSDENIFAAGDCVEMKNILTGKPCYVPLGSTANKQGRVAANSIFGLEDNFPGVLGSTVCKVFDFNVARTGLGEEEAADEGYDVVSSLVPMPDKPHFMPDAQSLFMKLIADKKTGKLLGAQAVGPGDADKRINVAAVAVSCGMTLSEVANLDLCYAPPYSPAVDNLITAANVLKNIINAYMDPINPFQTLDRLKTDKNILLLDVRSPEEYEEQNIAEALHIPLGELRNSLEKVPDDKEIIIFCKSSLRAYEAAIILHNNDFKNVKVMSGGIVMWPFELYK